MVQESGADSLRLDIVIETIAKLQAIDDTSARLQKLSVHSIQAQNSLGRFTGQIEGRMTPALQKSGAALADILRTGFGPKFIGSITGVNAALVNTGKTFQNYTNTALKAGAISSVTAQNFNELSQGMIGIGITGKATSATFDELDAKLAQLQPRTEAGRAGVKALSNELGLLKIQFIEAGNAAEQRLEKPLKNTQKAGQGLLLSFSLTQLAAGRLSQAFFGIGFAVLFTGFKFLNLITISVALGAALASILIDKLVSSFGKGATVIERISKRMQEFERAAAEAKGETALLEEEFEKLIESGEDLSAGFRELFTEIERGPGVFRTFFPAIKNFGRFLTSVFTLNLSDAKEAAQDYVDTVKDFSARKFEEESERLNSAISSTRQSIERDFASIRQEFERAEELKISLAPVEKTRKELDQIFDTLVSGARDETDFLNKIIRDQTENQINVRREALQTELDNIRDGQRKQTRVIQDALSEQTRAIGDALGIRLGVIRDQLDTQIDIIRDSAAAEIETNKEKIDILENQDRKLTSVLNDLESERQSIRAAIIGSEAELAELEAAAATQGVAASEEKTIIKARLAGLAAQEGAVQKTIRAQEKEREGLQNQIKALEDVADAIEDIRDSAIDAARDETKEREKQARRAADVEIREAQRATENRINAINDVSRTASRAVTRRANDDIREARRSADRQIEINNEILKNAMANFTVKKSLAEDFIKVNEKRIRDEIKVANAIEDRVIPKMRNLIELQLVSAALGIGPLLRLKDFGLLQALALKQFIQSIFPGADIGKILANVAAGFQFGGIVPGPTGKPQLIVAHGGEEVKTLEQQRALPSGQRPIIFQIENFNINKPSDMVKLERMLSKQTGTQVRLTSRSRKLARGR